MKYKASRNNKATLLNLIAKNEMTLPFYPESNVVLLPLAVDFVIKNR
jgi:hypothetical protein